MSLDHLPDNDSLLSSQALRRLRRQDHRALLAGYDATLLLAKSLLGYEPAFDAYLSMRNSDVDSDLGLKASAVGGAIGIATSFTTVSAPWYSLNTITSIVTGAGWPTVTIVSNPVGLAIGGALIIGTIIRKSQCTSNEELVKPERQCKCFHYLSLYYIHF